MKINTKELAEISIGEGLLEGRLHYKKLGASRPQISFKERWFKLRLNILFYFNLSETGTIVDSKPSGAFILENCAANYESMADTPFTFSIKFKDDRDDEKYIFSGRCEDIVQQWVNAINASSYEHLRKRFAKLQMQLNIIPQTGAVDVSIPQVNSFANRHSVDWVSEYRKPKKQESFRSYLPVPLIDGLNFCDNHFGTELGTGAHSESSAFSNSLREIGSSNGTSHVDERLGVSYEVRTPGIDVKNVISRPRPSRKAPEPPTRPPRGGTKSLENGQATIKSVTAHNLIDL